MHRFDRMTSGVRRPESGVRFDGPPGPTTDAAIDATAPCRAVPHRAAPRRAAA